MVRCRLCGRAATVRLRYANLSLCKEHFIKFFERRVLRSINRYGMFRRGDRVAVAVSGGKDSVVLLQVLYDLSERIGIEVVGLTIDLGIAGYSNAYLEVAKRHYERLSIPYRVIRLRDYGFTVDELVGIRRNVCSACGVIKRYLLNRAAREEGADVLATGHSMDDFLSVLLQAYIRGDLETLAKLSPKLPKADGLVARVKPLVETPERDVLAYALLRELEYVEEECPYAKGATSVEYKMILNSLEDRHPGIKFQMLRAFMSRIQPALKTEKKGFLRRCEECGEPSSRNVCQFCRLRKLVTGEAGKHLSSNPVSGM